jgi:uncharacterized protein YidB (DUF937 family)
MGLLDDLLGQLAGGASGRQLDAPGQRFDSPPERGSSAGMGKVMMALLPVVLGMLAQSQRARSGATQTSTGGGLADILGQVLGGSARGSSPLGDLLAQFQRAGFGDQARSWVSTGQNMPIPLEAIEQVFGRGGLAEIARRAGVSEQDASRGLSQLMPEVVDRVTPDGELPDASSLLASVEALTKRLGAG